MSRVEIIEIFENILKNPTICEGVNW
jgi:hypothetical protein